MKKVLYTLLAGSMLTSTCITPVKASQEPISHFSAKNTLIGMGALSVASAYGYANYKYGIAQVHALLAAGAATVGGLCLGTIMANAGMVSKAAEALEAPLISADIPVTACSLITAVSLGLLSYITVHYFLDSSNTVLVVKKN